MNDARVRQAKSRLAKHLQGVLSLKKGEATLLAEEIEALIEAKLDQRTAKEHRGG